MAVKKRKLIDCCVACHSPHLTHTLINGEPHYSCLRCGYAGVLRERKSPEGLKLLLKRRKVSTHQMHRLRAGRKKSRFHEYIDGFHLRMWFRIVSIGLAVFGFVLLLSEE